VKILYCIILFVVLHAFVWMTTNSQFMEEKWASKSFWIAAALAFPTTMIAYYTSRLAYDALNGSVWAIRFIGYGTSYLVFPLLTWLILKESMFTPKTMTCIGLSLVIIIIQITWK